jgi:predicted amidohydrolase
MSDGSLKLAVVHELFFGKDGPDRLRRRLSEARELGAQLAALPELPLHPWVPATRHARDEDAEPPEGPRHRLQAEAARDAGVGLLGGAIVRDPSSGRRFNRALLFDSGGVLRATYDKLHVPTEELFWESDHYDEGDEPPRSIDGFELPLGIQICSDLHRPEGCHLLGALGACVVLSPRATPTNSYRRWRLVARANAITSALYVVSINRTEEPGMPTGGASFVVAPDGEVILESTDPVSVVELTHEAVAHARTEYPGYLSVRASLYATAWARAGERS